MWDKMYKSNDVKKIKLYEENIGKTNVFKGLKYFQPKVTLELISFRENIKKIQNKNQPLLIFLKTANERGFFEYFIENEIARILEKENFYIEGVPKETPYEYEFDLVLKDLLNSNEGLISKLHYFHYHSEDEHYKKHLHIIRLSNELIDLPVEDLDPIIHYVLSNKNTLISGTEEMLDTLLSKIDGLSNFIMVKSNENINGNKDEMIASMKFLTAFKYEDDFVETITALLNKVSSETKYSRTEQKKILNELIDYYTKDEFKIECDKKYFIKTSYLKKYFQELGVTLSGEKEMSNICKSIFNDSQPKTNNLPVSLESVQSYQELCQLKGLDSIKEQVKNFFSCINFNKKIQEKSDKSVDFNLHMSFIGDSGTGKTTVARLMASILFEIGYLAEDKLIEVSLKDLVSDHIGGTAPKTTNVIESAYGGVLFIDEAYSLNYDNKFAKEAISTIVKHMEDDRDKLVIIFAGYEKEMNQFLNINSGLKSRIGNEFKFENYSTDILLEIFSETISKYGLKATSEAMSLIKQILSKKKTFENFGNARFVRTLFQDILIEHSIDIYDENELFLLTDRSIPEKYKTFIGFKFSKQNKLDFNALESYQKLLNLIGLENTKNQVKDLIATIVFNQKIIEKGGNPMPLNLNSAFIGNPGTGKTTVARLLTEILFELGCISENKLLEVSQKDLIGQHVGETAIKTSEVVKNAFGGVLFIDEAYSLMYDNKFAPECISTLLTHMENDRNKVTIIFAGYREEMLKFIDLNPGLKSRIGNFIDFSDFNEEELYDIFSKNIKEYTFKINTLAKEKIQKIFEIEKNTKNFSNARFVRNFTEEVFKTHARNSIFENQDDSFVISLDSIPKKYRELL